MYVNMNVFLTDIFETIIIKLAVKFTEWKRCLTLVSLLSFQA